MPKTSPTLDLVDWLANSGVLNLREAHALRRRCEELGSGVEFEQVIAGLAAQKKLTKYQAAEIRAGRHEELVQGNYLILDLIRSSQMGVVYRAQQMALHHEVALKILPEHVARAPDAEARFRREVEAIARLKHSRIVAACDAGRMGRTLYLAMEFIQGENLGEYIRRRGKLPLRDAVRCIEQAAEGLAAAHAAGIVHRDVKPSNLMLTTEGDVKVLDLGLARFLSEEKGNDNLTASEDLTGGGLLGTIDFMAPEQSRDSSKVDHRADIYGLGCTLYYLLAAVPPTPPGDWQAKLSWHESAPIPRLRSICPAAPKELQEIFDRMMARDVRQRYASCNELRKDLQRLLSEGQSEAAGTLRPGAAIANHDPLPPPVSDATRTDIVDQAQVETKGDFVFRVVDAAPSQKVSPAALKDRPKLPPLVLGIAGGVGVGVVLLVLVLVAMMLSNREPKIKSTAINPNTAKSKKKPPNTDSVATNFPIGTAVKRPSSTPQGVNWNRELKAEIDRIFPRGVESDAGRSVYSEADSAIERFLDADWYIGSQLTASGQAVQLQVRQGKFFTAPLEEEYIEGKPLAPQSIRRTADNGLRLRGRQLMKISAAEIALVTGEDGSQRVQGRVKTDVLNDVPIDSVSIVIEIVHNAGNIEGTQQIYVPMDWTKTEGGWHAIDRPETRSPIDSRFNYRLYIIGWSWSPKPGIFRLTQEYQGRFTDSDTTNE